MDDELLLRARTLTAAAQVIAQQLEHTKLISNNNTNNNSDYNDVPSPERLKQHNHHVHFRHPEEVEDKLYSWKGACIKGSSLITTFTDIRPWCPRGSILILNGHSYTISMEGDYSGTRITLSNDFVQDTNLDCMISIGGNELEQARKKNNKKVIKRDIQPVSSSAIQSAVQDLDFITNMKAVRNENNGNNKNNNNNTKKIKNNENNRTHSAPTGLINAEYINQNDNECTKRDIKDTIAYKMSSYEELYTRKDSVDSKVQREKAAKRVLQKMKEDKLKKIQEEKEIVEKNERIRAESESKAKILREKTLKRLAEKKTTVIEQPQITENEEEKQKQIAEKMANLELKAKRCRNETRKRLELLKAQDREKEKNRLSGIEKKLKEISEAKKVTIPTRYAMGQYPKDKSPNFELISMKLRDEKDSIAAEYDVMYGSEEEDDVCQNLELDREEIDNRDDDRESEMNLSVDSIEANTRNIRADSLESIGNDNDNDNVGYLRNHIYGLENHNINNNNDNDNGPSSPSSELTSSPSRQTDSSMQKQKKKIKKYKRLPVIPVSVPYIPIPSQQIDLR